jgi:hypothetical protein
MSKLTAPSVNRGRLLEAWQRTLPTLMNKGDSAQVSWDEANRDVLRIHIDVAGRTGYSFDFTCRYVDSREVKVDFIDVEKGHTAVDEYTEIIQTLADDYIRHIHECAQMLKGLTNGE